MAEQNNLEYPYNLMYRLGIKGPTQDQIDGLNFVINMLSKEQKEVIFDKFIKNNHIISELRIKPVIDCLKDKENFLFIKQGLEGRKKYFSAYLNMINRMDTNLKEFYWMSDEQKDFTLKQLISQYKVSPFDCDVFGMVNLKKGLLGFTGSYRPNSYSRNYNVENLYEISQLYSSDCLLRFDLSEETFDELAKRFHSFRTICERIIKSPNNWFNEFECGSISENTVYELYCYLYKSRIINEYTYNYLCKKIGKDKYSDTSYFKLNKDFIDILFEDFINIQYRYMRRVNRKKISDFNEREIKGIKNRLIIFFENLPMGEKEIFERHYLKKEPFIRLNGVKEEQVGIGSDYEINLKYDFDKDYFEKFKRVFAKLGDENIINSILFDSDKINYTERKIRKELYYISIYNSKLPIRTKNSLFRAGYPTNLSVGQLLYNMFLYPDDWFKIRNLGKKSVVIILDYLLEIDAIDLKTYDWFLKKSMDMYKEEE